MIKKPCKNFVAWHLVYKMLPLRKCFRHLELWTEPFFRFTWSYPLNFSRLLHTIKLQILAAQFPNVYYAGKYTTSTYSSKSEYVCGIPHKLELSMLVCPTNYLQSFVPWGQNRHNKTPAAVIFVFGDGNYLLQRRLIKACCKQNCLYKVFIGGNWESFT